MRTGVGKASESVKEGETEDDTEKKGTRKTELGWILTSY